jgi:hypothetical protein
VGGEDLDGDVAVELHVACEVDDAHAAAAELALERVLAGQGGLQLEEFGGRMRHHVKYYSGEVGAMAAGPIPVNDALT